MQRLQAKYEGGPKPINSSASIGGEQMTINVGIELLCPGQQGQYSLESLN